MTTNNVPEPQSYAPSNPQGYGIPASNTAVLPPRYEMTAPQTLPTYDEVSPGEPAAYVVPAEYRRPFGETPRDKRGKFWTTAFASGASAAASLIVLFTPFALYGINVVTAIAAIVLGIRALIVISKSPETSYSGKAKTYSWLGIAGGALSLLLTVLAVVGAIALFSYIEEETNNIFDDSYSSSEYENTFQL